MSGPRNPEGLKRRIVLLGPPASGKGTQAELIKARYGIEPTSTGAMLRDEKRRGTQLGIEADHLTSQGQLVPDALILELVSRWLTINGDSFVFDGFPRTLSQGRELERLLEKRKLPLDFVFFFNVAPEEIRNRVLHRVTCEACGRIFSTGLQVHSAEESCPVCGGKLGRRSDDTLEALERRMVEYREKTEPLVPFYRSRGVLVELAAASSPETVFAEISSILEGA